MTRSVRLLAAAVILLGGCGSGEPAGAPDHRGRFHGRRREHAQHGIRPESVEDRRTRAARG